MWNSPSQHDVHLLDACRLEHKCRQQEVARRQLQYSIQTELSSRGWSLWGSGTLSSRIKQALQQESPQQEDSTVAGDIHTNPELPL